MISILDITLIAQKLALQFFKIGNLYANFNDVKN